MWRLLIWILEALCWRPIRKLQGFKAARFVLITALCASDIFYTVRQNYERVYGERLACVKPQQCSKKAASSLALRRHLSEVTEQELEDEIQVVGSYPRDHELEWRQFPDAPQWWWQLKRFSTFCLSYVMLKYVALQILEQRLNQVLAPLNYPLGCILLGRFVINESFSAFLGVIFASVVLSWSLNMIGDLSEKTGRNGPIRGQKLGFELTASDAKRLRPRELFLLETMCFRMSTPTGIQYVLRQNRTLESHTKLRQFVALGIYTVSMLILVVGAWIFCYCLSMILLDSRYLRVYPKCDPHLQHLSSTNQLGSWSITLTRHRFVTFWMDFIENVALWAGSGLFLLYGTVVVCFVNYDLLLQWDKIDERVQMFRARSIRQREGLASEDEVDLGDDPMRELRVRIMDFFVQVQRADVLISDALKITLFGWLYLVASFTYFIQGKAINLPLPVILVLLFIIVIIFVICINLLQLHRRCGRSYPSLCSLIAHDTSPSRKSLSMVLDMYVLEKSCYTLLGQYPFVPTTLISLVGYSVSCFFLISSLLQERSVSSCRLGNQTCLSRYPTHLLVAN